MNLSDLERFEKILERDFEPVRKRIEKALEQNPKHVTFEQALEQVKRFSSRQPTG